MKISDWISHNLGTLHKWSDIDPSSPDDLLNSDAISRLVSGRGGITLNNGIYLAGDIRFDPSTNTLFINTSTDTSNPIWQEIV